VFSPDYDCDEEEGDDGSPFSPWSVFSSIPILTYDVPSTPAFTPPSPPVQVLFHRQLRQLRC
jgi:hypothetical protein